MSFPWLPVIAGKISIVSYRQWIILNAIEESDEFLPASPQDVSCGLSGMIFPQTLTPTVEMQRDVFYSTCNPPFDNSAPPRHSQKPTRRNCVTWSMHDVLQLSGRGRLLRLILTCLARAGEGCMYIPRAAYLTCSGTPRISGILESGE
jgi:hypothetical protein